MLRFIKKLIPSSLFQTLQPVYHYGLALAGAIRYGFPSKKIKIIGITGTKGKTSTTEIVNSILEQAGYKTALGGTLRFKIGSKTSRNMFKMSMPGRFFMQKFIHDAVVAHCDWIVLEMTSEGVKQFRHKWIDLDALIVTNVSPEHIESHGSFEKYLDAKLELARSLARSSKTRRILITNKDDEHAPKFIMNAKNVESFPFSLADAGTYSTDENGVRFIFRENPISSPLHGIFNIQNILAAGVFAESIGISPETVSKAVSKLSLIRGRVEYVTLPSENPKSVTQNFDVIVDYAHTIDSLTKLYETFPNNKKICVLGNTGGGRDTWKRKGMAEVADTHCDHIILTNEDPYDEDPMKIINDMKVGISKKPLEIIMDRRKAINTALRMAKKETRDEKRVTVLISGKGTDPYIMEANGKKTPWDDADVVREELEKILS
jgi:UDP-N-acetylmuramyl-tripeptide synthetase